MKENYCCNNSVRVLFQSSLIVMAARLLSLLSHGQFVNEVITPLRNIRTNEYRLKGRKLQRFLLEEYEAHETIGDSSLLASVVVENKFQL